MPKNNPYDSKHDILGGFATLAFLLVGGAAWYFGYVQPQEEELLSIVDCTEDASRAEWDRCVSQVRR